LLSETKKKKYLDIVQWLYKFKNIMKNQNSLLKMKSVKFLNKPVIDLF